MKTISYSPVAWVKYLACAILLLGFASQAQSKAADANGTWTWSIPGRNGGPDRTFSLKLKADGEKLTGPITVPGRGDNAGNDVAITDGKINGEELSFSLSRPGRDGGSSVVTKYSGKIAGDKIVGKIQSPARDGGAPQEREWKAERKTEK